MINTTRSSRLKVKISEVDFKAIIAQALTNLRNLEGAHRIEIKTTIEGYIPFYSDADQLAVIFSNLISNAIKFSPPHKHIYLNAFGNEDSVLIEIKDEGPGFSDEDKSKMFNKFARLSAKPTGNEHSTGLGLSIVKKLCEILNAEIELKSVRNKGSKFIIKIRNS